MKLQVVIGIKLNIRLDVISNGIYFMFKELMRYHSFKIANGLKIDIKNVKKISCWIKKTLNVNRAILVVELDAIDEDKIHEIKLWARKNLFWIPFIYPLGIVIVCIVKDMPNQIDFNTELSKFNNQVCVLQSIICFEVKTKEAKIYNTWGLWYTRGVLKGLMSWITDHSLEIEKIFDD